MKKSVLIGVVVFSIFALSFTLFLHDKIFLQITGKQIFSDTQFEQPAESFKSSKSSTGISLSPDSIGCQIIDISSSHTVARIGKTVSIYIDGEGCDGEDIDFEVYEDDLFFNDHATILSGEFLRDRVTIDWTIGEDLSYLFDEAFEGDDIELYFETNLVNNKLASNLLYVYLSEEESPLLQPLNEEKESEIKIIFWMVFVILVSGIAAAFISILSSFKRMAILKT
ncbi:MAG: hypothetical protein AABW71_02060 [Nanoarchaeota archaeon]